MGGRCLRLLLFVLSGAGGRKEMFVAEDGLLQCNMLLLSARFVELIELGKLFCSVVCIVNFFFDFLSFLENALLFL